MIAFVLIDHKARSWQWAIYSRCAQVKVRVILGVEINRRQSGQEAESSSPVDDDGERDRDRVDAAERVAVGLGVVFMSDAM